MSAIYYYKRRTKPIKWLIIILIMAVIVFFLYWFYTNYFSKIDVSGSGKNASPDKITQNLLLSLSSVDGDVQMAIKKEDYVNALKNTILHNGDKIKTGSNSRAILKLENGSTIRLGANTEIILQNTEVNNFVVEELKGRVYYSLSAGANYQIRALNVLATALGTKFEVINNADLKYLAILALENNVKVEIFDDNNNFVVGSRLDPSEKALIDLKNSKNEMLKIESFSIKSLAKEAWYKWNFDLDQGLTDVTMKDEPEFEEIASSLELITTLKEENIYLSWSVYDGADFKSYQIVKSETKINPKYPDDSVIKSSDEKDLNFYVDDKVVADKTYYYRVCVVKMNDNIACGNVASEQLKPKEEDKTPPLAPTLSINVSEAGVGLSWTKNQESDFKEYKILRAAYNSMPVYPGEAPVATKGWGEENYLDKEVNITSVGSYYYRICSVDNSENVSCSNIKVIENGQVK
ncbi:FecR domain-containing protein [Candidatus Falkowbacteria bacterium]|nr:FecR domain-containing protein [Candidatus Falkowbacteria bacterium]